MSGSPSSPQVVFIHGLWIHASAWGPWQELFADRGYTTSAPGWPGDSDTVAATRASPDALNEVGITAICRHYADLIDALPARPIVVGHSFGGLIAQELLANGYASAAVAIDPAPIKGVKILPFSYLRSGFPVLGNPANRKRTVALTAEQFRYASATRSAKRSRTRCSRPGRSPARGVRCSRTPWRTSCATRPLPSTPTWRSAARCC